MRRLLSLGSALSLATAGVGGYALYASWSWPFRTALFPRVIALPLLFLALIELALSVWSAEGAREGRAVDFQFTDTVEPVLARKRTIAISLWTLGFLALIVLVGFPLAVPIFVFVYLRIAGREPWALTIVLTVVAWLIMEGLFDRFLHLPFPEGWIFALWT
ncbi:MAG TPA: tripartite tricarboxylate transporter TctB family protein [Candidatus Eisenbacteria bacterium]|nr:tripartite tricarboxylate transporter TctB family protein [Candidatus Eisenbacteria bacterium]